MHGCQIIVRPEPQLIRQLVLASDVFGYARILCRGVQSLDTEGMHARRVLTLKFASVISPVCVGNRQVLLSAVTRLTRLDSCRNVQNMQLTRGRHLSAEI